MFKIGDSVTKEQFIKYGPLGMVLKQTLHGYGKPLYMVYDKNCTRRSRSSLHIQGFNLVYGYRDSDTYEFYDVIRGFWDHIESKFTVHKLPKQKILKRRP